MKLSRFFLIVVLMVFTAGQALAQQQPAPNDSHKYRTILTIAGAAGGFATGFYIGQAAYDTPDAHRKLWTTATIMAGVGGAGGYLIGRAIDSRRNRINVAPIVSKDVKGLQLTIGF